MKFQEEPSNARSILDEWKRHSVDVRFPLSSPSLCGKRNRRTSRDLANASLFTEESINGLAGPTKMTPASTKILYLAFEFEFKAAAGQIGTLGRSFKFPQSSRERELCAYLFLLKYGGQFVCHRT